MNVADFIIASKQKMQKALDALRQDLSKVRTGRAHTGFLDHVQVDYFGTMVPIAQAANVTLLDPHTIGIQAWDKGMLPKIEKAIREAELGLNPASQGDILRVPMPTLNEERRRELIKVVRHDGEVTKIAIRNLRRDANAHFKEALKKTEISEDEMRRAEDEIQKLTDRNVAEVDKVLLEKENELMSF